MHLIAYPLLEAYKFAWHLIKKYAIIYNNKKFIPGDNHGSN
jgi:hypothetical protein